MRKATLGALLLGIFALTLVSPLRELGSWHRPLGSLTLIGGYLLLSLDPPEASKRQRDLFIAGILCSVASFALAFLPLAYVGNVAARVLAVGVIALPVWLVAGPLRAGFVAAGVLALVTIVPQLDAAGGIATSTHGYVAALSIWGVAVLLHRPALGAKKPPRVVVASNIVTLTPDEKARALANLEKRYQAGEIAEHVYLDKKQELESR